MKIAFLTLFSLCLIVASTVLNGYAFSVLWEWFVVSLFDLPELSISYAIGIGTLISLTTHQSIDVESPDRGTTASMVYGLLSLLGRPLIALFIGWIVK